VRGGPPRGRATACRSASRRTTSASTWTAAPAAPDATDQFERGRAARPRRARRAKAFPQVRGSPRMLESAAGRLEGVNLEVLEEMLEHPPMRIAPYPPRNPSRS
jgi:hypothetical protein